MVLEVTSLQARHGFGTILPIVIPLAGSTHSHLRFGGRQDKTRKQPSQVKPGPQAGQPCAKTKLKLGRTCVYDETFEGVA